MLVSATTNAEIAKLDESHKATREQLYQLGQALLAQEVERENKRRAEWEQKRAEEVDRVKELKAGIEK
jgi:hypothetical protein